VVGGRWPTPAPAAAAPPTAAAAASAFDKREAWRRETTPEGVHVCRGTWCTYDGSREVLSRFRQAIKAMGMQDRVRVRGVPCMAFCQTGPFVKVLPDKTRYWDVTPEAVDWIISQHFDPSQPPRTDIVPDPPGVETGPIERAPYGVRKGTIPAVIQSAMMRLARLRG
jgi:(2Fe-2S) ferredoxin